ncbi:MAG: RDD family protein [Verrucomicrobia subdivision 3 bacterium]|nr:RDD family protein [Limisphaerales bacterium]
MCAECGALQPKDNAIKYGEDWICAGCKPLRIQKLKEGVLPKTGATAMDYAGVGGRFLAKFLDMLIIGGVGGLIMGVVTAILVPMIRTQGRSAAGGIVLAWLGILTIVVVGMIFYQIWCLPKYGATPGKRILGLRVVTADGGPISVGRAIGRFFGEWVTGLIPFWIGYLIAAFDSERRTVHDHIAGTRVIKV